MSVTSGTPFPTSDWPNIVISPEVENNVPPSREISPALSTSESPNWILLSSAISSTTSISPPTKRLSDSIPSYNTKTSGFLPVRSIEVSLIVYLSVVSSLPLIVNVLLLTVASPPDTDRFPRISLREFLSLPTLISSFPSPVSTSAVTDANMPLI